MLGEGTGRDVYEIHADNFAGCLLMPRTELIALYDLHKQSTDEKFRAAGMGIPDKRTAISYIANQIARHFEVSAKAAEIRLTKALY